MWPSPDGWAWSGPPPERKKHLLGKISPIFLGHDRPNTIIHGLSPAQPPPTHKLNFKKKKLKSPLKKIVIVSNVFLQILYNIGLYIYTVKYKSGIKILYFLRNNF
jgi:hypothetical protein